MKRFLLFLAFVGLLVFPLCAEAQNLPDDEGVVIEISIDEQLPINGPGRSPSLTPISAIYYSSYSCIQVCFQYNIGNVTTVLNNSTAGYHSSRMVFIWSSLL